MAYNITFTPIKMFSPSPTGTPLVNDWYFNPPATLRLTHIIGAALPDPISIDTVIKNYYSLQNYESVIVRAAVYMDGIAAANYVDLSGAIQAATPAAPIASTDKTGYDLDAEDLTEDTILTFKNLQLLTEGIYTGHIRFDVYSVEASKPTPTSIDVVTFPFELTISATALAVANPQALAFTLLRNNALPASQALSLTVAGNWIVRTDKKIAVSAPGAIDNSSPTQTIITGTGNKTITVSLTEALKTYPANSFQTQIIIYPGSGTALTVPISVTIIETDVFDVSPSELIFTAVKGFTQAQTQSLSVSGFGAYTLTAPSWMVLSSYSGTDTGGFTLWPISPDNLSTGTYTGFIVVKTTAKDYQVPVTYVVEGSISTTLDDHQFNFTKDNEYLTLRDLSRDIVNIVKIALTVKVYDYIFHTETEKTYNYVLPFFQYATKMHLGEVVGRLLKKPIGLQAFQFEKTSGYVTFSEVYRPASVSAHVQVINRTTTEVVVEENLTNMLFVAGKKPKTFAFNGAVLCAGIAVKRVTATSKELLNFLLPPGVYTVSIKAGKNAPVNVASQSTGNGAIFRYALDFSTYQIGDTVQVMVANATATYSKAYQLLQQGDYSNHIGFINQYNVLELLEFTGDFALNSDIKQITHKYYKNLVEHIENLDSTKVSTLSINTGAIFKDDQLIVDELLRSKKAWLIFDDKPAIELVPKDKKLTNYDSDQELYDFEILFDINPTHDAEAYTF